MIQSTLSQEPWLHDPTVADLPWREERTVLPSKLAFGVYLSDSEPNPLAVRPIPPVKRGLDELVSLIRKLGHDVIEWEPPSHSRAMEIGVCAQHNPVYCSLILSNSSKPSRVTAAPTFSTTLVCLASRSWNACRCSSVTKQSLARPVIKSMRLL